MKALTPFELYQQQLAQNILTANPAQEQVMQYLDQTYQQLCKRQRIKNSYLGKLRRKLTPRPPIRGLYVWGSVGIGKTHLVNLFYQCLPTTKIREHFHVFMQNIQRQLFERQGSKNPLNYIAQDIAAHTVVLILDEFFVTNIADAMILGELLKALIKNDVCLITTSNIAPDQLYLNGLQRENFLPAIELIKQHTRVLHLVSEQDYRLRSFESLRAYYTPLNDTTEDLLEHCFAQLAYPNEPNPQPLQLFNRTINIRKQAEGVIWFDFAAICGRPRSVKDYIALSQLYQTIIISNVPLLTSAHTDLVISFIFLIDVLYDENIRVILSAAVPITELYPAGELRQRFERCESRLIEMQNLG